MADKGFGELNPVQLILLRLLYRIIPYIQFARLYADGGKKSEILY